MKKENNIAELAAELNKHISRIDREKVALNTRLDELLRQDNSEKLVVKGFKLEDIESAAVPVSAISQRISAIRDTLRKPYTDDLAFCKCAQKYIEAVRPSMKEIAALHAQTSAKDDVIKRDYELAKEQLRRDLGNILDRENELLEPLHVATADTYGDGSGAIGRLNQAEREIKKALAQSDNI